MNIAGWEWARHKIKKQKLMHEAQKQSRAYAEKKIEWLLPEHMLPVECRKIESKFRDHRAFTYWYTKGSKKPDTFVYLLKTIEENKVIYVGLTDDPPRRHMEHRRNKQLGTEFKMSIVAVGDSVTEREWIRRCIAEGHELINRVSIKDE